VNYLPDNEFREDSHPTLGGWVLRGASTRVVQQSLTASNGLEG